MPSPKQSGQPSGGMFQKYTGEQINQIPEGYVQAMGSMGQAYQSIGQSLGNAFVQIGQAKANEAKLKGTLGAYLKRDPRVQMVDASISAGNLVKGADGKIGLAAGIDEGMLSPDARSSIDFYNKIGGDGSALSGSDLTKFATEFETEQKIASLDSEKADKAVDRALKAAQIKELESKAIKNLNTMGNAAIIGGLGSGQDIPNYNVPTQTGQQPAQGQTQAGQPQAFVTPVVNRTGGQLNQPGAIDFSRFGISPVYTTDRANAGAALTTSLGQTPISASRYYTAPEIIPSAPAEQALPASATPEELKADIAMLQGQVSTFENSNNGEYNEGVAQTIQTLQGKIQAKQVMLDAATAKPAPATGAPSASSDGTAPVGKAPVAQAGLPAQTPAEQSITSEFVRSEQTRLTNQFNTEAATLEADFNRRKLALAARGATTGEIDSLTKTYTAMLDGKRKSYDANYANVGNKIEEQRKAAKAEQDAAAAARAEEEYRIKFGYPAGTKPTATTPAVNATPATATTIPAATETAPTATEATGTATAPTTTTATRTPKTREEGATFAQTITDRFGGATQGRIGGTAMAAEQRLVRKEHNEIMSDHPAWWQNGMYTQGAKEYQWGLSPYPVSAGIDGSIKGKVQEEVTGYVESQNFLQVLYKNIESGDDNAIRNYLDRFLIFTSKDESQATAELANQFGVAAFRRAIVSGGNFSDADREYVAKIITNMNSPSIFKDKKRLLVEAKALAKFIDSKFRSTLSSQNVTIDPVLSRKFLESEGNQAGLITLEKTENFFKTFSINPSSKPSVYNLDSNTVSGWRKQAAANRKVGNEKGAKLADEEANKLESQLKAAEADARKRLSL